MKLNMGTLLQIGGGIVVVLASYFGAQMTVAKDISSVSERTAKLETSVPQMQNDISEIKESVNAIRDALLQQALTKNKTEVKP